MLNDPSSTALSDTSVEPLHRRAAWLALTGCLVALFMQMLDTTIVNIALPDLAVHLHASSSEQLLVLTVYTLAFACTLLTTAALGGRWGRRRVFMWALFGFTGASVLCGLAGDPTTLVAFRALAGVCAALMSAQTLALIAVMFPRDQHAVVFGFYGAVAGVAAMSGPILGGLLISADVFGWGWRAIFFVNVPLGVLAYVLVRRHLPESRDRVRIPLDVPGIALSGIGLFALLYPLAVGREKQWPAPLLVMLAASGAILIAFCVHEVRVGRRGGTPLLQMRLFTVRPFAVGVALSFLFFSLFASFFFTVSLSAQFGLGYSALKTGLLTVPFALGAIGGSLISPVMVGRLGPRTLTVAVTILAVGLAWLALVLEPQTGDLDIARVLAPLIVGGFGTGMFVAPLQATILSGADAATVGSASGVIPTVQQIGASIGLAIIAVFFFGQVAAASHTAIPSVGTELDADLAASGVETMFTGAIVDEFSRCASAQLTSAHPDQPAPGCAQADAADSGGIRERLAQQSAPAVAVAAREVAARTFTAAMRTVLYGLAILAMLVAGLTLLLRRGTTPA